MDDHPPQNGIAIGCAPWPLKLFSLDKQIEVQELSELIGWPTGGRAVSIRFHQFSVSSQ